jgi:hypothetical protein
VGTVQNTADGYFPLLLRTTYLPTLLLADLAPVVVVVVVVHSVLFCLEVHDD